ncbi:MAG: molybdopterin-dependent oxidoreductase [Chloroflexi bacterium]|nr:molybdopterin-dependent oxidoreductase [Chloroflexota bacterium]
MALPATTWAEREGTYTSFERRVQRIHKAIEPTGESRPAWQIICDMAGRMGAKGFGYTEPCQVLEEAQRIATGYAGISYPRLDQAGGVQVPCPSADHPGTPVVHADRFPHGLGRLQPLAWSEPKQPASLTALVSVLREVKGTVELNHQVMVELNAADGQSLGIHDGERVTVSSGAGSVKATVRVNGRAPAGYALLALPHHEAIVDVWNKATPGTMAVFARAKCQPVKIEKA